MESATLLKFGEKFHLDALRDLGIVYMNPLNYFKKLEEGSGRGDRCEGAASYHQGNYGTGTFMSSEGKEISIKINAWDYIENMVLAPQLNVFCMYALRPMHGAFPIPEENFRFGEYVLILLDAQAFIEKLVGAAKAAGIFTGLTS